MTRCACGQVLLPIIPAGTASTVTLEDFALSRIRIHRTFKCDTVLVRPMGGTMMARVGQLDRHIYGRQRWDA